MVNKLDQLTNEDRVSTAPSGYKPLYVPRSQAPRGAVYMSQQEIIEFQKNKLETLPLQERFWFRTSPYITMTASILTANLINAHFRQKFHLRYVGAFATIPVLLVPSMFARVMDYFLSQKVMLLPECQGCLEVRSGVIHVAATILPTMMLSPSISVLLSRKHYTYLTSNNFQPNIRHILKSNPMHWANLAILSFLNFGIGALVRHKQREEMDNVMKKVSSAEIQNFIERLE